MNARALMKRLREERRGGAAGDAPGTTAAAEVSSSAPSPSSDSMSSSIKSSSATDSDNHTDTTSHGQLIERIVEIKCNSARTCRQLTLLEDPTGSLAGGNGATLWDSSLALTNFLTHHYADTDLSGKYVLELGAGVGLVGMALASMGANVVVTERDIALPLLRRNVDRNAEVTGGRVEVAELSWSGDAMQKLIETRGYARFDIVVGSDLIFPSNSGAYSVLADTYEVILKNLSEIHVVNGTCNPDRGDRVVDIWLSHEPRIPTVEDDFFKAMKDRGILVQRFDVCGVDEETKRLLPEDISIYKLALDT